MSASPKLVRDVDAVLLRRIAEWPEHWTADELSAEVLLSYVDQQGIDFATALLYDRLRRKHQSFISAVEGVGSLFCSTEAVTRPNIEKLPQKRVPTPLRIQHDDAHCPGANATRLASYGDTDRHGSDLPLIVVVPGAFYREFPGSGADGRQVLEEAARHGCRAEFVPISGFGSPRENGRDICAWLAQRRETNIILVSLSKGASDIKFALAQPDANAAFRSVNAWFSLSGLVQGTPLSNWLQKQPIRSRLVRLQLWWFGYSYSVVEELRRGGELDEMTLQLPDHLRLVHVVGFPLQHHLTNGLSRRGHRRLAVHGPNDSTMPLSDLLARPGQIYPVWGADHYLRPAGCDMRVLFGRLLMWFLATQHSSPISPICPIRPVGPISQTAAELRHDGA